MFLSEPSNPPFFSGSGGGGRRQGAAPPDNRRETALNSHVPFKPEGVALVVCPCLVLSTHASAAQIWGQGVG